MNIRYGLKTAYEGLYSNKARSLLTILGIVIGIAAIILIVSIGKGAEQLILTQVEGMGADMVVLRPGKEPTGPSDMASMLFSDSLTQQDVEALQKRNNVPNLVAIAPSVIVSGNVHTNVSCFSSIIFPPMHDNRKFSVKCHQFPSLTSRTRRRTA